MTNTKETVRLAAVGDIHCGKTSQGTLQPLFAQAAELADVLLLCGDLTDYGLPEEAHVLVKEITAAAKIPIVAVLGNHDYESGKPDEVRQILVEAGVTCSTATMRDPWRRLCRHQRLRRRFRPRDARILGRADDQALCAGGARRSAEAGVGAGAAAHAPAHRGAALCSHSGDRGGRAAGDLCFSRM